MKRKITPWILLSFFALLCSSVFSSCGDEDVLGGLEWSVSNSNPENIKVDNQGGAQISINVGNDGGEVVLTCTNYSDLTFHLWNDKEETYYECDLGTFTVNKNKVTCTFPAKDNNAEDDGQLFTIRAKDNKKTYSTILMVNYNNPASSDN